MGRVSNDLEETSFLEAELQGGEFCGEERDDCCCGWWGEDDGVDAVDYAVCAKLEIKVRCGCWEGVEEERQTILTAMILL